MAVAIAGESCTRYISYWYVCNKIWRTSAASMRVYQPQIQDSCHSGRMKGLQLLFLPPWETTRKSVFFLRLGNKWHKLPTMSHARLCYTCLHPPVGWLWGRMRKNCQPSEKMAPYDVARKQIQLQCTLQLVMVFRGNIGPTKEGNILGSSFVAVTSP